MAVAAAGDEVFDDEEVGFASVLVVALLRGPAEDIEGQVRVGLGLQGLGNVRGGEARLQGLDPRLELFLRRGSRWLGGGRTRVE